MEGVISLVPHRLVFLSLAVEVTNGHTVSHTVYFPMYVSYDDETRNVGLLEGYPIPMIHV